MFDRFSSFVQISQGFGSLRAAFSGLSPFTLQDSRYQTSRNYLSLKTVGVEMKSIRPVMYLLVLLLSLPFGVMAQKNTGTIRGAVTDSSGAMVAGAEVTVTNNGTGESRTVTANEEGQYVAPDLAIGTYSVSVKKQGFKGFVAKDVELHVASIAEVNVQLQVGITTESVTVTANALQVQTDSAVMGEVVTGEQVRGLPLNGGNFVELLTLQPGVSAMNGPGGSANSRDKGILGGVDYSVNGNPTTNNLFLLDGANNNDKGSNRTILIYPAVDSIAEFKMLRNSYGPEYGQASGAVVIINTKSGENTFHGSVNYFGRNDALNSFEFFAAESKGLDGNPVKDKLRRNDYGYTISGPIKKNKIFFFWSEEWNKEIRGQTHHTCAPTPAEIQGDFTGGAVGGLAADGCGPTPSIPAVFQAAGNPLKIANPDPAGLLYAQLLPTPNLTTLVNGENYFKSIPSKINWREESIKTDFNLTKDEVITLRYTQDAWENPAPHLNAYWGDNLVSSQLQGNWSQPSRNAVAKLTSTVSSSLINTAQFSYSHNEINTSPGGLTAFSGGPAALIKAINAAVPTVYPQSIKQPGGLPIFWSGFQQYGSSATTWLISPYANSMDTYTLNDDIVKIHGTHTFKAGVLWSTNAKNEDQNGGFDQPQAATADWGVDWGKHTGNGLANLLIPNQTFLGVAEASRNPVDQARWHDLEFYFGDTWKVRRNLTVEYGIRWSLLREPYDSTNAFSSFDPKLYNPLAPASDACNGVVTVPGTDPCGDANKLNGNSNFSSGTPGVNRSLKNNDNHAIAPRVGIAWDPFSNGKMAIRLGAGQFFQRERVTPQVILSANSPFATTNTQDRTLGVAPSLTGGSAAPNSGLDPRAGLPNSWQWNVAVEREIMHDSTFEVAYVGNRGLHLTSKYDANQVTDAAGRLRQVFNSSFGPSPNRPFAHDGVLTFFNRAGLSSYHALQALYRTRMKDRLQMQFSYTYSHTIANGELDDSSGGTGGNAVTSLFTDLTNPRADRGNTTINRPHIFVANAIWSLPKLVNSSAFVKQAFGGWEFSSIFTASSGASLTVFDNAFTDQNGAGGLNLSGTGYATNQRPNIVAGMGCNSGAHGPQIINPAAFTLTGFQLGTIGNEARGYCQGPRFVNGDLGLHKNFSLTERFKLQFRLDAFNAFNHANFRADGPNLNTIWTASGSCDTFVGVGAKACSATNSVVQSTSLASVNGSFGKSTLTLGSREIQYGLKLTF
jgi:Carboxypeptidase regulatory-like domain